jgi:site-specific DNA-adenine methylase
MNTPIKYFGGKSLCFKDIFKYFPNREEYNTYIEPFGGSFSLGLKMEVPAEVEIYNDLEQNVYSLYKVLSDPEMFQLFKSKCDLAMYNEDIRREFKELLKHEDITLVERAFYFFYTNRTSHNGIGGFSMATCIRRGMSKSTSDFLSAIDRLQELHDRMSKVIVTNMDGNKLIRRYDDPRVLCYCDPPYEQSTRTAARYKVDMDRDGHIEFLNTVIESKSKIIISGYDCELYDKLTENGFSKIHFDVNTIGGDFKPKTKVETLWKNF